ncbi:ester cyclase [Nocardia sp. NPDC049149]|uniref:ester cyclase n=1 Tax=Nocardia sp. NPDC049149 TaxID=3364315 RepID=UPI00371DB6FA
MTAATTMPVTSTTTRNTASEMVRNAKTTELRVASRMYELFDVDNLAGVDEIYAPDLLDHDGVYGDPSASGIDGARRFHDEIHNGFTNSVHRLLFQAQMPGGWVVSHWEWTAEHTGPAFGFEASDNKVQIHGTDIVRIDHEKIVEIYHVEELQQLFEQLGK